MRVRRHRAIIGVGIIIAVIASFAIAQNYNDKLWGQDASESGFNIPESILLLRMFATAKKGIVYCYSGDSKATGFFVSADGWILTAGHKVDQDFPQQNKIYVKLSRVGNSPVYESVKIAPPLEGHDIMLFKIDYKPDHYFKRLKSAYLFEEHWVVGYRGEAGISVSGPGFIANHMARRSMHYSTARAYFGNSGSPALNRQGDVIGVVVMVVGGLWDTYLVPAPVAEKYIKDTLKGERK